MGNNPLELDVKSAQPKQSPGSTGLFSIGVIEQERPMRKKSTDSAKILPSDITPYERYVSRRALLAGGLGLVAAQSIGGFGRTAFAQPAGTRPSLRHTRVN